MNKRGFTLIELMTVISIIAILAAILFPLFAKSRETARRVGCGTNLHQIGMALNMYAQAYDGHFPRKNNNYVALGSNLSNRQILHCPSDASAYDTSTTAVPSGNSPSRDLAITQTTYSYVFKGGLTNDDRADTVMGGEIKAFHGDMVNVLYLGGHVRAIPSEGYAPVVAPDMTPRQPTHNPRGMSGPPLPSGAPSRMPPAAPPPPTAAKGKVKA